MARIDIIMPKLGESIVEGTVVKWLKAPGDRVAKDESVLEITTDKVDSEIPSPAAGVLVEIVAPEGTTVAVDQPLGVLETDAAAAAEAGATAAPQQARAPQAPAAGAAAAAGPAAAIPSAAAAPAPVERTTPGRFYSPLVRRIAQEEGIPLAELDQVPGSGAGGRVNRDDLLKYIELRGKGAAASPVAPGRAPGAPPAAGIPAAPVPRAAWAAAAATPAGPPPVPHAYKVARQPGTKETRIPFDHVRKKIAEHMVRSVQTSPHVTSCTEADVTGIVAFREAYAAAFEASQGFKLTYTPFFLQAVVRAIQEFPMVNGVVDGEALVVKHDINLGLAVALQDGGLIVPVIRNAEEKNFVGLARAADDLGHRARAKKLVPDDVVGGTFSITNPGVFGGLWGTPIINQPQVAIFGMGAVQKRPVVINNMIAIRDMVYLTLSYDHRVIDGALGVQFLERVVWYLERFDPTGQIPGVA